MQGGFPVPDGFIVSTEAYAHRREEAGLASVIADGLAASDGADGIAASDGGARSARRSRTSRSPTSWPPRSARRTPSSAAGRWRSAPARPPRTWPEPPFAGQQDTYLNVVGDDRGSRRRPAVLGIAVDRTGPRLPPSPGDRVRQPADRGRGRQQMVEAELAGVMFTANPVTGDRDEIVDRRQLRAGRGRRVRSGHPRPLRPGQPGQGSGAYVGPTRGDRPQHRRRRRHPSTDAGPGAASCPIRF